MTEQEVYDRFIAAVRQAGGQRAYAQAAGLSPSYINDVVNHRRAISRRLLGALGIACIKTYTYVLVDSAASPMRGADRPPDE